MAKYTKKQRQMIKASKGTGGKYFLALRFKGYKCCLDGIYASLFPKAEHIN